MRTASIVGILLIIAGTAGLIWGGFQFPQTEEVAEVGPVEVQAETTRDVTIPPWVAGATVLGGIVLVGIGSRKK